jgi:Trk K+ transport system NAD-binding subunit
MNEQIFWIILKRLRAPFLVLVVTFSISILGLILIPGMDDAGREYHMTFFDAFYFVSYMASTIGFGEAPYTFTYPQRIWVSAMIYITVIGWFYGIGTIVSIIQDEGLKKAINRNSFIRQVAGLGSNFFIILGYNSVTKSIINRINNDEYRVVVLDRDESKIDELILEDFYPHVPAYTGEATKQQMLKMAGIHRKNCIGVIALFGDDTKNTQIATICKLLNKKIDVIVKASSSQHLEHFKYMDLKHVQNPFDIISKRIYYSITAPHIWLLEMWMYGHSLKLRKRDNYPKGKYIICGYGRMGHAIEEGLKKAKIEYVLYNIDSEQYAKAKETTIFGDNEDRQKLLDLGVKDAVCIIAATKDDLLNLTILNKAKSLNKKIFTVARENSLEELNIFQAAKINKIYVLEQILADSTYNHLAKPLSEAFIKEVRKKDEAWAKVIVEMLNNMTGLNPNYFETIIDEDHMYALSLELAKGTHVSLAKLRRSRENRDEMLHIVYLILKRDSKIYLMPDNHMQLKIGDELLVVADDENREDFEYITNNIHELNYILGMDTTKVFLETN